jgi:phosphatidylethanolamine/phosphatidyl-N-methylethanolamine N-methyltransferase
LNGIDLSEAMLAKARRRIEAAGREDIHLEAMDAQALRFADHSFDQVVAMYVVSVAPDAAQVLREMRRVCKPGGTLTVVNLLAGTQPLHNGLRRLLTPLAPHLGFRPLFSLPQFRAIDGGLDWKAVDGKDSGLAVLQAVNP